MGKVFQGLSSKILPNRQDQCLKRKDYQFPIGEGRTISEALERLKGYIQDCPYHGLNQKTREHLDATTGGSFLSLSLGKAKKLMEKISDNQSWSQDKGEEAIEEVNALSTKMDDLLH